VLQGETTRIVFCELCADRRRDSPDAKRPRLTAPLPGPAPYSVPASHSNSLSSPQIMGPPTIRLQTGLHPSHTLLNTTFRPTISPSTTLAQAAEDRPQDAEQLQDALASAGVDLKAEEYNLSSALMGPSSATGTQGSFIFPQSYTGGLQIQHQLDDGIFNRPILSRFVDRIGKSV
jgi:hypothetical protein